MIIKAGDKTRIDKLGAGQHQTPDTKPDQESEEGQFFFDEAAAGLLLSVIPPGLDPSPASPAGEDSSTVARMKFMITRQDEKDLRSLGYSQAQIHRMRPEEAQDILRCGRRADTGTITAI